MPFFSPWITAVFIISLTFPFHSEPSFNYQTEYRLEPSCQRYSNYICTKEFDPVCASNRQTYGNICMFCSAKRASKGAVSFLRYGVCQSS
ncbi:ovomucoid-like [Ochotona princeps]|uniref:ovomucoid-like n=1 Tax=Ochotona princeps TaxID=9978 RepID=UPI0027146DA4|nr:ovomucoid-like [Ochotona princeps]